jgi:hypothetical protein
MGVSQPTSWMGFQCITDSFSINVYSVNARHEIPTISFHEDRVFCPVIVFILYSKYVLKQTVIRASRIKDAAIISSATNSKPPRVCVAPSSHYVAVTTEYFGQTADHDICERQYMHIHEVPNCFIHNNRNLIPISYQSDTFEVRGF